VNTETSDTGCDSDNTAAFAAAEATVPVVSPRLKNAPEAVNAYSPEAMRRFTSALGSAHRLIHASGITNPEVGSISSDIVV
ncbi:MAG: hypothetical protein ACXV5B_00645, partial [Halobacteriota archaeon]